MGVAVGVEVEEGNQKESVHYLLMIMFNDYVEILETCYDLSKDTSKTFSDGTVNPGLSLCLYLAQNCCLCDS